MGVVLLVGVGHHLDMMVATMRVVEVAIMLVVEEEEAIMPVVVEVVVMEVHQQQSLHRLNSVMIIVMIRAIILESMYLICHQM